MTNKNMKDYNSQDNYQQITQKATQGMGWNYLTFGLRKLLTFVTISILAHILDPEIFGLAALATVAMDYLSIFNDLGLGAAIIQRKTLIKESSNIAFLINVLAGLFLTIFTFLAAPLAALFFQNEEVIGVLRWLSLSFVISSLGSVHNILLQRELNFKKRIIPDLSDSIIKAIISITLAYRGYGVWALVFGQLAGTAISSCLLWVVLPWRPRIHWDTRIAKELFQYGLSIMGVNALSIWEDSFDYVVIGKLYTPALLGIYTIAYRLPQMLIINNLWVLTAVIFPAFSSLQDDRKAMKKLFLSIVRYVEIIVIPISIGLVVAADPIIRLAFGEQWTASIPILRVLSIYALVLSIGYHVGDIYKAIGRPDILIKLSIPIFGIRIIALLIGAQFSILGVSYGHLVTTIIALAIQLAVANRLINISLLDILKELKAFIAGIVLVVFTLPVIYFTQTYSPILQLTMIVTAGAIGYLGTIWIIERNSLIVLIQLIKSKISIN